MSLARRPAGLFTRFRRVLAFVAIVWGVAASFVIFELVMLNAFDAAQSYPGVLGRVMLSRATTQATGCDVQPGERTSEQPRTDVTPDARAGAWQLGLSSGFDAGARQRASMRADVLRESAQGLASLAADLKVPTPHVFAPQRVLEAHGEFTTFIEADAARTAHQLAVTYSPEVCHLYKLGAFWGYSALERAAFPGERTTHAVEIRHHARAARVPEALWQPMAEPTPREDTDRLMAETGALTQRLTKYLANAQ